MVAGADQVIQYDPPGAIGLVDPRATFLIQFAENTTPERPQDSLGVCDDFDVLDDTAMPEVVDGVTGRAREFDGSTTGIAARDRDSGATLLTRDMSIQVILSWDAVAQLAAGTPGTIINRGTGASVAEYVSGCLQLDVVDAAAFVASVRWFWQDVAGVDRLQAGASVVIRPNEFTMLTATRRWVSPTEVVLRYYVGALRIGEVTSTNGSIGGGTTGAMQIGYRTVSAAPANFYTGRINEILTVDRELTLEEIEATWLRITLYQPRGEQLFKEMIDKGYPLSEERTSDAQLEIRWVGQLLGYAAAQTENLRANFLPRRSYGSVLEDWEEAVLVTPAPNEGIDSRRARVEARMRQRRGSSIPGFEEALVGLLGGGATSDLEFLAFDNTIREPFDELAAMRWDVNVAAGGNWTGPGTRAVLGLDPGTYLMTGAVEDWRYAQLSAPGSCREAQLLAKVVMDTPDDGLEVGLFYADRVAGNFLLLGLRDNAGSFEIITQSIQGGVASAAVVQGTLVGVPTDVWLWLRQTSTPGTWKAAWSETSGTTGFTVTGDITHPASAQWAGIYGRSTGALAAGGLVLVDDLIFRDPYGDRPFNAYVMLDRAKGFSPDIAGCRSIVEGVRHGYIGASFVDTPDLLCDDLESGCDQGCMGGI